MFRISGDYENVDESIIETIVGDENPEAEVGLFGQIDAAPFASDEKVRHKSVEDLIMQKKVFCARLI